MEVLLNREIITKVDRVAVQMEEKYGYCSRLLELVPADLADKFTRAKEKFDQAINTNSKDLEKIGESLIRGYTALDKMAAEQIQETWEVNHPSGKKLLIYKGARPEQRPGFILMSIEELIKFVPGTILEIKKTFPKGVVK